jgi:hypothetical protein
MLYTLTYSRTRGTWQAIDTSTNDPIATSPEKHELIEFLSALGWKLLGELE